MATHPGTSGYRDVSAYPLYIAAISCFRKYIVKTMAAAAPVPTVTGQVVGDLQDPEYLNWYKSNRALHCTIDVLRDVSSTEMQSFHNTLLGRHGSTACSKPCTHKDIKPDWKRCSYSIPCPSKVCSQWLADIVREKTEKSTRLNFQNSDLSQWQTEPWQIAKIYMDRQDMACVNRADTDPAGILQLLLNCKLFKNLVDKTKVDAVRNVRNALMHNANMKVTQSDLKTHIQTMVNLLEDPLRLLADPAAKQAVTDINLIETTAVEVNDKAFLVQERMIWKKHITDLAKDAGDKADSVLKDITKLISSNMILENRLQDVINDVKEVEKRVGAVEANEKLQDEKIEAVAKHLDTVETQGKDLKDDVRDHAARIANLEAEKGRTDVKVGEQVDQLSKEVKPDPQIVGGKLKKALQDLYSDLKIEVIQSVDGDQACNVPLDDMFVELRLQKFNKTKLPETPGYRDVEELQRCMMSSDPIKLSQLFDKLQDKVAPRNILILGPAGSGKSTVIAQMSKLWARGELWEDTVEYLFVITLRQLQQDRKWTLAELLLGGLPLTDDEKTVALELLQKHSSKVMIVEEGLDELNYHDDGVLQRDGKKAVELNRVLASITKNAMLPGTKVVVTSRPNNNTPRCDRTTELYGFTQASIQNYIRKFSREDTEDTELGNFIRRHLQNNVNLATLCYLPVQCNFVCVCLSDMYSSTHTEDTPNVSTMTELYVLAAINLAKKHDPSLKHMSRIKEKTFFDKMGKSLKCHAELAKHCTMSTPLRIILYEDDLKRHGVSDKHRHAGFLAESETKGRTPAFSHSCWSFHHLSIQEMFAAVGLLLGPPEELLKLVEDEASVCQREILIKFVVGLWCDPMNAYFREHLGLVNSQLDPHAFIKKLARVFDTMQLLTVVHESQRPDLLDLLPEMIESFQVFPTEMLALSWVLRQPECRVTKLNLSACRLDTDLVKELSDGLSKNKSITFLELFGCGLTPQTVTDLSLRLRHVRQLEELDLSGNDGCLSTVEAAQSLVAAVAEMSRLSDVHVDLCGVTDESLAALAVGLGRWGQLKYLGCWDNPRVTDDSRHVFCQLMTDNPQLVIGVSDCSLSSKCVDGLRRLGGLTKTGRWRFN